MPEHLFRLHCLFTGTKDMQNSSHGISSLFFFQQQTYFKCPKSIERRVHNPLINPNRFWLLCSQKFSFVCLFCFPCSLCCQWLYLPFQMKHCSLRQYMKYADNDNFTPTTQCLLALSYFQKEKFPPKIYFFFLYTWCTL